MVRVAKTHPIHNANRRSIILIRVQLLPDVLFENPILVLLCIFLTVSHQESYLKHTCKMFCEFKAIFILRQNIRMCLFKV